MTEAGPCHWVEPDLCSACSDTAKGPVTDAGTEILAQTQYPGGKLLQLTALDMIMLQRTPPIECVIGPLPALHLLSTIQLAMRHPDLPDTVKQTIQEIGRGLQEYVSVTENLAAIAAAGWNSDFDMPVQPERRIILPGE